MPLTTQVITAKVLDKAVNTGKCCTQGGELFAKSRALGDTESLADGPADLTERQSRVRIVTGGTA